MTVANPPSADSEFSDTDADLDAMRASLARLAPSPTVEKMVVLIDRQQSIFEGARGAWEHVDSLTPEQRAALKSTLEEMVVVNRNLQNLIVRYRGVERDFKRHTAFIGIAILIVSIAAAISDRLITAAIFGCLAGFYPIGMQYLLKKSFFVSRKLPTDSPELPDNKAGDT